MAQPAGDTRQYFLGIGGQQTGPHSEQELLIKIQQGEVPRDALVWYDGLPEWQPIATVEYFSRSFAGGEAAQGGRLAAVAPETPTPEELPEPELTPPSARAVAPAPAAAPTPRKKNYRPLTHDSSEQLSSFASDGDSLEPVFKMESRSSVSMISHYRNHVLLAVVLVVVLGGIYYVITSMGSTHSNPHLPGGEVHVTPPREQRQMDLQKALSELMLRPESTMVELRRLATENGDDKVGKDALEAALNYYRQMRLFNEAGRLLMDTKHPAQAATFYLKGDAPNYRNAEEAYFSASQVSKGVERQQALVNDIKLLLGPLKGYDTAIDRIKILDKEFPGNHPYRYYLKSTDDRIKDIFYRMSFFFVQNLMAFVTTEFPQINMVKRPAVEVRRDKSDGRYRLVGIYSGDVVLNKDQLPGIKFVFWQNQDTWIIVETNVTQERARHAQSEREKHLSDALPPERMLAYLESVFRAQYPDHGVHETISSLPKLDKKKIEE